LSTNQGPEPKIINQKQLEENDEHDISKAVSLGHYI